MNKLGNALITFIKIIFAAVIGYLLLLSIYSTSYVTASYNESFEYTYYAKDKPWIHLIALVIVLALFIVGKKLTKMTENLQRLPKIIWYVFPFLVFASLVFWVLATDVRLGGDQYETFLAARSQWLGDYSHLSEGGYIFIYPNQIGLMMLESALVALFGTRAVIAFLGLNAISLVLTYAMFFRITRMIFSRQSKSVAYITYFAMAMWTPLSLYVGFAYGNLIGLMLSTAGLWFTLLFLQQNRWKNIIAGAICIALAIQIKNNYLIILLAMLALLLLDAIRTRGWKPIVGIAISVGVYMLSSIAVNICVEQITKVDINSGIPKVAWIAMGLQENEERANGWYNGYNILTYMDSGYDAEKTKEICLDSIKNNLDYMAEHPQYSLRFFGTKIASQWNNPTFQCFWIYKYKTTTRMGMDWLLNLLNNNRGMVAWLNIVQSLILGGTFLYLLCNWKQIGLRQLLLPIGFLGGFFFHLIWEAKAQYTFTYFVLLFPYAVMGLDSLAERINSVYCKRAEKKERNRLIAVLTIMAIVMLLGAIPTQFAKNTWQLEENSQLLDTWQWE